MKRGDDGTDPTAQPNPRETGSDDTSRVGETGSQGTSGGGNGKRRQASESHSGGDSDGRPLPHAQEAWDHLRSRHPERIRPEDLDVLEDLIIRAYQQAQPSVAWSLTTDMLTLSRKFLTEAAKARFRVNFGTDVCERCDGLRAGEGVAATCYQQKLCYFDNFKKTPTHRRRGIIEDLVGSFLPTDSQSPMNQTQKKT